MKHFVLVIFLSSTLLQAEASKAKTDALCAPLLAFVSAVQPQETKSLTFRTSWGENFKDTSAPALSAKRCEHEGYEPAKALCRSLVEHGAVEFAEINLKRSLTCLSPELKLNSLSFRRAEIKTYYGTEERGSVVDFDYMEDAKIGGTVLTITVRGY
jgi:hypothetical protein